MTFLRACLAALLATSLVAGCGGNDTPTAESVATDVVARGSLPAASVSSKDAEQWVERYIVPGFAQHAKAAEVLLTATRETCNNGEPNKPQLLAKWRNAFLSWQQTNYLLFGPLNEEQALRMQFHPDKRGLVPQRVTQLMAQAEPVTAAQIAKTTAPLQGYPAVEQLLISEANSRNPRYCESLVAITQRIASKGRELEKNWQLNAAAFAANGSDAAGRVVDSLQRAVNRLVQPKTPLAARPEMHGGAIASTLVSLRPWFTQPDGLAAIDAQHAEYFAAVVSAIDATLEAVDNPKVMQQSLTALSEKTRQLNSELGVYTGFNADDGD